MTIKLESLNQKRRCRAMRSTYKDHSNYTSELLASYLNFISGHDIYRIKTLPLRLM